MRLSNPRSSMGVLAPALALALLAGCAKAPFIGKSSLRVTLAATPDCNDCGKRTGYPLTFRVLQVTDPSLITGMSLTQLWDKEEKLFGPALVSKFESFIDPGQRKTLPIERADGATAAIIVANYCRSAGACWYYTQPFSKGGKVDLVAGAECLSASR